jgi:hypothetical protein
VAGGLGTDKGRIRLNLGEEGQLLYLGRQKVVVEEAARVAAVAGWGGGEKGDGRRSGGERKRRKGAITE